MITSKIQASALAKAAVLLVLLHHNLKELVLPSAAVVPSHAEPAVPSDHSLLNSNITIVSYDHPSATIPSSRTSPPLHLSETTGPLPDMLPQTEWIDDIDLQQNAPCGTFKCLFRSKRDPRLGYLVAQIIMSGKGRHKKSFRSLQEGWNLAENLREKHGIRHKLLAPPQKLDCPTGSPQQDGADQLDKNECISNLNMRTVPSSGRPADSRKTFLPIQPEKPWTKLLVQPARIAESPLLQFGCNDNKVEAAEKVMGDYIGAIDVADPDFFEQELRKELNITLGLVREESCLLTDFQVLLDGNGKLIHLDFDRCFESKTKKWSSEKSLEKFSTCKAKMDVLFDQLFSMIRDLAHNES